jgi:hypothetical protein
MPIKKGSAASGTSSKRGVSTPSNKYAQGQMKSGNPKPSADAPSKRGGGGKSSKKGSK